MFINTKILFLISVLSLILSGCDPVHDLKLENNTKGKIEVLFYPELDQQEIVDKVVTEININGKKAKMITLEPTETIKIGRVVARNNPKPRDIRLDYLEVRSGKDTLKMVGQRSIFSAIQKVDKLDWRLVIRDE